MVEIHTYRLQIKLESHGDEVLLLIRSVKTNPWSTVSALPVLLLRSGFGWNWNDFLSSQLSHRTGEHWVSWWWWAGTAVLKAPLLVQSQVASVTSSREGSMTIAMEMLPEAKHGHSLMQRGDKQKSHCSPPVCVALCVSKAKGLWGVFCLVGYFIFFPRLVIPMFSIMQ